MKGLVFSLVAIIVGLQVKLWSPNGGYLELWYLADKIVVQQQENLFLTEKNLALKAEVSDLKVGFAAVEERARQELGMIKVGETFFQTKY